MSGCSGAAGGEAGLGCLAILLLIVVLPMIVWVIVEVAIPTVGFVIYFLIRGQLALAVNSRHRCKGDLPRSLGWGALWATLFVAPLTLAVWLVHWLAVPRGP